MTPSIEKFISRLKVIDNKIELIDIKVEASLNGNWIVYHKGEYLTIVNSSLLNDELIMDNDLEYHPELF